MDDHAMHRNSLEYCLILLFLLLYSFLRLHVNSEYQAASMLALYYDWAPLPFAHRILVPLLSRPFVDGLAWSVAQAYLLFETIANVGLFLLLRHFFLQTMPTHIATRAAGFLFLLLPFTFLWPHYWNVYYPYDSLSMLFTAGCVYSILLQRWYCLAAILFVGAFNRETLFFMPFLLFFLHRNTLPYKKMLLLIVILFSLFFAGRYSVQLIHPYATGSKLSFYIGENLRLFNNFNWLLSDPLRHLCLTVAGLSFMPIAWLWLWRDIPEKMRAAFPVIAMMFFSLLLVGNLYEPRIFGELIVISYMATALGAAKHYRLLKKR